MKSLLKFISYAIKGFFAILGLAFILSLFADNINDWSFTYEESLDGNISELQGKIEASSDPVEQVHYTLKLVELKKRKIYLENTVAKFNESAWSSIFNENGIDGAIEYLKIDANFEDFVKTEPLPDVRSFRWLHKVLLDELSKEQRYYLLAQLYEFKSIMEENSSYRDEARIYLEKSLAVVRLDWNVYQYASFLLEDNKSSSIALYKEAISLSEDKEFIYKIKYHLAKALISFQEHDEAVKIYRDLLEVEGYKEESLTALSTLFNDHRAIEYFEKIKVDAFEDLDSQFTYMKAKEHVAMIYLYKKEHEKAKEMLEELLGFYHDISSSNPEVFVDIANVNRHLFTIYKVLEMKGSQKESLKRAIFYYKALNDVYENKYLDELNVLKKLQKELGE